MNRPTPGQIYTSRSGDTLLTIAAKAYGLPEKWTLIRDANQLEFVVDSPTSIQAGESVFIPQDPELVELRNARRV